MVTIQISEDLAQLLAEIARAENRSIDDVAASILEHHISEHAELTILDENAPPGSLAALLKVANEANIASGYTSTAERSREILNNEYPAYLRRKYELTEKPDGTETE